MQKQVNPHLIGDFATRRLNAVHWSVPLADPTARAALLRALPGVLTADVTRDLPPSFSLSGDISDWVDARSRESDVYAISAGGQLIGLLVLFADMDHANHPAVHLGYLFTKDAWGQGYATELLTGLIKAARAIAPVIFKAGVASTNPASAHLLRKLGFSQIPQEPGAQMLSFALAISG